ncbi:MAG: serine/threonine protein kinase [Polyangiaceae bacterium]|nr:serine/threonine protein kinase [Polyangiaceae bacterium]MCL4754126.1 serine/threonine protein kinase [Myxococcales bacterium]
MIALSPRDDVLAGLEGQSFASELEPAVRYRLDRVLGAGGMSVAFFALRIAPDGESPVVMKIMRPAIVAGSQRAAALLVAKEAVALGRLNEQVPTTPFVVRLVDTGALPVSLGQSRADLPWIVVEYVHGGPDGTTLEQRVGTSLRVTGQAFDPERASLAIECLASGLSAIHDVGVIHRDLKPANVLCCGFGDSEIFKIADFGIARPTGMIATFGGVSIGTPGYAPPEQFGNDSAQVGPWSDVFSFGCVIYYFLTGEDYFAVQTPAEGVLAAREAGRRRLLEARALCSELRQRQSACEAIDAALAQASSYNFEHRPPSAKTLAQLVVPSLRPPSRARPTARKYSTFAGEDLTVAGGWRWTVRHTPGGDRVVRCVAWESGGRCLAATSHGLDFWNGTSWQLTKAAGLPDASSIRVVRRLPAGQWLVGGDRGYLSVLGPDGVKEELSSGDAEISFTDADGDLADLAVLVGSRESATPLLYSVCGRRWLRPAALSKAARVSAVCRTEDEAWLVAGRGPDGGFLARFEPLMWNVTLLKAPDCRAYLAAAARPDLGVAVAVGSQGRTLMLLPNGRIDATIPGEPDVSAVAIDPGGGVWAASAGRLWLQRAHHPQAWNSVWHDATWEGVPIVSVHADLGVVTAMTVDGGIIEGSLPNRVQ